MSDPLDTVRAYHQRTKHQFRRFAAGPGGMDWDNQPDPFRTFAGSRRLELPLLGDGPQASYTQLYQPGQIGPQALTIAQVGALLELSFGLSAWKQYQGSRWALRCNPSSGNLHPTEAYVILDGCPGVASGIYHYVSRDHVLEQRCAFPPAHPARLPAGTLLIGLTSIHWREAWKYGERAYRYCQHDLGHAAGAVRYAAAALGWHVRLLEAWSDADVGALLGTGRGRDFGAAEHEQPDLMLQVDTTGADGDAPPSPDPLVSAAGEGQWTGRANRLSAAHSHRWPVIDEVTDACRKPRTIESAWQPPPLPPPAAGSGQSAAAIIRRRRSAQALDGVTAISAAAFHRMLDMTLPRAHTPPWDAIAWEPRLHLLLFVHRVEGLEPGLYLFLRNRHGEDLARVSLHPEFEWLPVAGRPDHFALWRLAAGDARDAARALCCHQDIAADGAFSVAMLAEYDAALEGRPWAYRQLHWEAGLVGQVLYLEAEAAGMRGTGIGCYFDDGVHELLAIDGTALQSIYHFTIGGALTDSRLQTLPPYAHLPPTRQKSIHDGRRS
ncbi:MAG: SagB/ThcOx family dehydrogenase [Gammaproteobacteria bacterium]